MTAAINSVITPESGQRIDRYDFISVRPNHLSRHTSYRERPLCMSLCKPRMVGTHTPQPCETGLSFRRTQESTAPEPLDSGLTPCRNDRRDCVYLPPPSADR